MALAQSEFERLLEQEEDNRFRQLYRFAVLTGMRRGEIVNLLWKDVDTAQGMLTVQSSEHYRVKHGKARSLPITEAMSTVLSGLDRSTPFVFTDASGNPFKENRVTRAFKAAARLAALPEEVSFHSLRATCASWLASKRTSPLQIKEILGHAQLRTTEHYTSVPMDDLRTAINQIAA